MQGWALLQLFFKVLPFLNHTLKIIVENIELQLAKQQIFQVIPRFIHGS